MTLSTTLCTGTAQFDSQRRSFAHAATTSTPQAYSDNHPPRKMLPNYTRCMCDVEERPWMQLNASMTLLLATADSTVAGSSSLTSKKCVWTSTQGFFQLVSIVLCVGVWVNLPYIILRYRVISWSKLLQSLLKIESIHQLQQTSTAKKRCGRRRVPRDKRLLVTLSAPSAKWQQPFARTIRKTFISSNFLLRKSA